MATLKAMELENGQWVYMQVDENILFSDTQPDTQDSGFEHKGIKEQASKAVGKLGDLIRAMTDTAAQALSESALGNVNKVTLEFGIKLGGEAGIPFITNGKAEGSVNIKVEFSPKKESAGKT